MQLAVLLPMALALLGRLNQFARALDDESIRRGKGGIFWMRKLIHHRGDLYGIDSSTVHALIHTYIEVENTKERHTKMQTTAARQRGRPSGSSKAQLAQSRRNQNQNQEIRAIAESKEHWHCVDVRCEAKRKS